MINQLKVKQLICINFCLDNYGYWTKPAVNVVFLELGSCKYKCFIHLDYRLSYRFLPEGHALG